MYGTKKTQQTVTYVGIASTTEVWWVGGGGPIDDGGWCEIYINRKFCLFLSAAYSQNSKWFVLLYTK